MPFTVASFPIQPIVEPPQPPAPPQPPHPLLSSLWGFSLAKTAYLTCNDHLQLGILAAYSKTADARN